MFFINDHTIAGFNDKQKLHHKFQSAIPMFIVITGYCILHIANKSDTIKLIATALSQGC